MDTKRNKYDKRDSLEIGEKAEALFAKLAGRKGWQVTMAPEGGNIDEHWDFLIESSLENYKVDVKGMKRVSRGDPTVQDTWLWVELHSVRSYNRGWLYDGEADLIAVEKINTFVLVRRVDLLALVEQIVDLSSVVSSARQAKYKVYSRRNRPDKISLIETKKLESIKWDEWEKVL